MTRPEEGRAAPPLGGEEKISWADEMGVTAVAMTPPLGGEENTSWTDDVGVAATTEEGVDVSCCAATMPPLGGDENTSRTDDVVAAATTEGDGGTFPPLGGAATVETAAAAEDGAAEEGVALA